ncbi:MvaI/BcnI family restriction endonuclease [Hyphomonas sp.]|uniref:MvaI/BcnI family restriction endonuclease n=1 Tax=Hyphomonas sp. TaxID=87 RepID=UPI003D2D4C9A
MLTLSGLIGIFRQRGATRFFAKKLAPNDNSKNQIYLGGDFSALGLIPHEAVFVDETDLAGSVRDRAKAKLRFHWYSDTGFAEAPNAQLILYPRYPEVRLSGLLQGCRNAPNDVITVRDEGRMLLFGVHPDGTIYGFACLADHPVAKELETISDPEILGVFIMLTGYGQTRKDTRRTLIEKLRDIHLEGWIPSQKLGASGFAQPYTARNGGGYTLEARLGISANGFAEPDYLGWEIKQFGVKDLAKPVAKSQITLMTPEPVRGVYRSEGPEAFVRRFGYADKSGKHDRINFGGIYQIGKSLHSDTGLQLDLTGFNPLSGKVEDMTGAIRLVTRDGEEAATWPYTDLIDHWNRKHARAAYIPSVSRDDPTAYAYGSLVSLYENTDFLRFLTAMSKGHIVYDPALKLEHATSPKPKLKRRSQFRIRQASLFSLYASGGAVNVLSESNT